MIETEHKRHMNLLTRN